MPPRRPSPKELFRRNPLVSSLLVILLAFFLINREPPIDPERENSITAKDGWKEVFRVRQGDIITADGLIQFGDTSGDARSTPDGGIGELRNTPWVPEKRSGLDDSNYIWRFAHYSLVGKVVPDGDRFYASLSHRSRCFPDRETMWMMALWNLKKTTKKPPRIERLQIFQHVG